MENKKQIEIDVFDAANIKSYAETIDYNSLIPALAQITAIYDENHLGRGNKEIEIEDVYFTISSIIRYCNSVEALRTEINHALELKDLSPYYK